MSSAIEDEIIDFFAPPRRFHRPDQLVWNTATPTRACLSKNCQEKQFQRRQLAICRGQHMLSRFSALFLLLATLLLLTPTSCWNRSPLSNQPELCAARTATRTARDNIRERSGIIDSVSPSSSTRRAKTVPFRAGCCFFFCACNVFLPSPSLAASASGATLFAQRLFNPPFFRSTSDLCLSNADNRFHGSLPLSTIRAQCKTAQSVTSRC